ncbi:MAG TPA: ThuA domain-containing protein [Cytophagaceae bacterium]|jgi:cytochrome c
MSFRLSLNVPLIWVSVLLLLITSCKEREIRILVFSKTTGFRHNSIGAGKKALLLLGKEKKFAVDTTEDASRFNESTLSKYSAVIFLNTTGDILNFAQQTAFERYIQAGGGFVGIHSATDTEYDWPWYSKLVGAQFESHPEIQKAKINVTDKNHPSTEFLPDVWERTDEWYNFKNINPALKILAKIDEKSYKGGKLGSNHPMVWYHEYDGGRSFYTEFGHTDESYSDPTFLKHIYGGIQYAIGDNERDFAKAKGQKVPEEDRFSQIVLSNYFNEPMEIAVSNQGQIYFTQRYGQLKMYDEKTGKVIEIGKLGVQSYIGNGLVGITLDPSFETNNYIYLFYTSLTDKHTVARFRLNNKTELDTASRKILLEIPIELESSAHTGGSLAFDKEGNLFISVGDNTVPFESNGYAPIDEREGRRKFDAQRSSGNTNDLRGKILRIHPEQDGTYTIPTGNLFPPDGKQGRPEIFVMGNRNPYRISVDPHTSVLYWGEVGPDAGVDSAAGPRGYDEINRAAKAGNYGWPYFVADNKAYTERDFAKYTLGEKFKAHSPINTSPNNTGSQKLPPAQKALIYYPYAPSKEFPILGQDSRNAMAGPVYYYNDYKNSAVKFPKYYDGKLFIYDWMRNWIMAVTLTKEGKLEKIEPVFANMKFNNVIDMQFGPDGALYLIEYGTSWYSENDNARLIRIEYSEGNRPPIAKASCSDTVGAAPLKVRFEGGGSYDPDGDDIIFEWRFDGNRIHSREKAPNFIYKKPGIYYPTLTTTDPTGKSTVNRMKVIVGNSYPELKISLAGSNNTFFSSDTPIKYKVTIKDKEDKDINYDRLRVSLTYVDGPDIVGATLGHQMEQPKKDDALFDKTVFKDSDCKSCHSVNKKSVGPAFMQVAKRYINTPTAVTYLTQKVIKGGGGVWGEHAMSAHPQLPATTVTEMVNFILELAEEKQTSTKFTPEGTFDVKEDKLKANGQYILSASYTDRGIDGKYELTSNKSISLKNPLVKAVKSDVTFRCSRIGTVDDGYQGSLLHGSYVGLKNVDLNHIKSIVLTLNSKFANGNMEIRKDTPQGELIGSGAVKATGAWEDWYKVEALLKPQNTTSDLYFVFKNNNKVPPLGQEGMINLKDILFKISN